MSPEKPTPEKPTQPYSAEMQRYYDRLARPGYPVHLYFPAAMYSELAQHNMANGASPIPSETENGLTTGPPTVDGADPKPREHAILPPTGVNGAQKTGSHINGHASPAENTAPTHARFDTIHTIQTSRPAMSKQDKPVKLIVGTDKPLNEANRLAMMEVYEYCHELAHMDGDFSCAPDPNWIRKEGTGTWPMTWKVGDGRLSFSLITTDGDYVVKEEVAVVVRTSCVSNGDEHEDLRW